jgi:hypothetical protein
LDAAVGSICLGTPRTRTAKTADQHRKARQTDGSYKRPKTETGKSPSTSTGAAFLAGPAAAAAISGGTNSDSDHEGIAEEAERGLAEAADDEAAGFGRASSPSPAAAPEPPSPDSRKAVVIRRKETARSTHHRGTEGSKTSGRKGHRPTSSAQQGRARTAECPLGLLQQVPRSAAVGANGRGCGLLLGVRAAQTTTE